MYKITAESYLDQRDMTYKKLIVIDKLPIDKLKSYCRVIQFPKLSPFKTEPVSCKVVFTIDKINYLTIDNLSDFLNLISEQNYEIQTKVTRLIQHSDNKINQLLFWIKKS